MANKNQYKYDSGSNRDKFMATPKQNKWKDPFYCEARGTLSYGEKLFSHKIDSIREHLSGTFKPEEPKGFFKIIGTAIKSFFSFNSRKGLS